MNGTGKSARFCAVGNGMGCRLAFMAALAAASTAQAALQFTIAAPNGVGDVVALTNAIAQINALSGMNPKNGSKVLLEPGVYDLAGIAMNDSSHLYMNWHNCLLAGLGDGPADTVLLGAGDAEKRRVVNCYGSNYGWCTVSNLTVTGGWVNNDGGGILGNSSSRFVDLVVSNNYAAGSSNGGGGGAMRGRAENCLFADNRSGRHGGGLYCQGGGGHGEFIQGAFNCTFANNSASSQGGGFYGYGKVSGSSFHGNTAAYGGGAAISELSFSWSTFSSTTEIDDCDFVGNALSEWGHGSAVYNAVAGGKLPVSSCRFVGNSTSTGGYGVAYGCDLEECEISRNYRHDGVLFNCNLQRCLVVDNTNNVNVALDGASTSGTHTNANSLFLGNVNLGIAGVIGGGKRLVNCTLVGNVASGGNYGNIARGCPAWNCLFARNKVAGRYRDVRANFLGETAALAMTNCVFTSADVPEDYDGLSGCRLTERLKLADFGGLAECVPAPTSPAADKGLQSAWIMELVGGTDLCGNARVVHRGLDIGAFECQKYPPVTIVVLR